MCHFCSYEDVRSAGKTLEVCKWMIPFTSLVSSLLQGQVLEDALRKLSDDQPTEAIEKEVVGIREKVTSLRKQLHTLNSVQKSLGYVGQLLLSYAQHITRSMVW